MPGRAYKADPKLVQFYSPTGKRIVAQEYRETSLHALTGFSVLGFGPKQGDWWGLREEDEGGNLVIDVTECQPTGRWMDEGGAYWVLAQCHQKTPTPPEPVKPAGCSFCDSLARILIPLTKRFDFTCAQCGAQSVVLPNAITPEKVPTVEARIRNAVGLADLLKTLQNFTPAELREVDLTDLPTYGGTEPTDTSDVWSWDAENLLVGRGEDPAFWMLIPRKHWKGA